MKKVILAAVLAVLILPLAIAGQVQAGGLYDDKIIFGDNFTLAQGEKIDGDLVAFGGNVTIAEGATVSGSVVVFGGNVDIAGVVDDDLAVFGGNTQLRGTAVVGGELATFGGATTREEGAQVKGRETQGFGVFGEPFRDLVPDRFRFFRPVIRFYGSVFETIFTSLALGFLALLVVLFWPEQTARVSAAITNAPGGSGVLGLLTLIAVPILLVGLAITLCLAPLSLVGALLYAAAIMFGWLALGTLVGARLSAALRWHTLSPAVSAAIGTFLFTLVASVVQRVPCVGWLVPLVLACVGLGAVTLTRFGTQPYLRDLPSQPVPPAPPAAPDVGATAAP